MMASEEENSQESDEQKYDISKIVDFPGFNVDPGPNFYDVSKFSTKYLHVVIGCGENRARVLIAKQEA